MVKRGPELNISIVRTLGEDTREFSMPSSHKAQLMEYLTSISTYRPNRILDFRRCFDLSNEVPLTCLFEKTCINKILDNQLIRNPYQVVSISFYASNSFMCY